MAGFPLRLASIDTGSNAIRFKAAEFLAPGTFRILEEQRVPVRLGHQVFLNGRLAHETMDAAVQAFEGFQNWARQLQVSSLRAVATSAVREARNGAALGDRIRRFTGIRLEVITGSEEARLAHLAVANRIDLKGGQWILVDLGGGSVEVSLVDEVGMLWSESHTMGSVRLLEELAGAALEPGRFQHLLTEYISVLRIPASAQYWEPAGFIATGGNIEALAGMAAAPRDSSGVSALPLSDLRAAIDLLSRLSFRERIATLNLREDRADVILPAALVYLRLAELARADRILVPHTGVAEGVLLDLADDLTAHASREARQERQLRNAAVSLGRRFMFDEAHGTHVADLAIRLFDQLKPVHGLGSQDRLVLTVAAILHDIGMFVAYKKHHKHSQYLISRSDLPGLPRKEMAVAANVARYHRRGAPARHHSEFMRLSETDRIRVERMSSILRMADALDRQQRQLVHDVAVSVEDGRVLLALDGEGDLLLERWALAKKKGLFESTFGLQVSALGPEAPSTA